MKSFIVLLFATITAFSQTTQKFEILGVSKISTNADHTVLKITIGEEGDDYHKLVIEVNDKTETIRKLLHQIGLSDEDIIISDFITRDNSAFGDFDNNTSKYQVHRRIKVKYIFDKDLNSKIINKLATHPLHPNFKFEFGLSDEKKIIIRNELIKKALVDAKNKADVIASTYNLKIKRILNVRYGNTTIDPDLKANSVDLVGETTSVYYTEYKEDSPEFDYMETILVIWEFE